VEHVNSGKSGTIRGEGPRAGGWPGGEGAVVKIKGQGKGARLVDREKII